MSGRGNERPQASKSLNLAAIQGELEPFFPRAPHGVI